MKVAMPLTQTKLRQWAQEHEAEYGPDGSTVIHAFPDGWTVRAPVTVADHWREGTLMGNCVGDIGSTSDPLEPLDDHPYWYSLRDPDNIPHVSWSGDADGLGRHNSPVKEQYRPYLDQLGVGYLDEAVCYECGVDAPIEGTDFCQRCVDRMSK